MKRLPGWIATSAIAFALTASAPKAGAGTSVSINVRVGDPYRGPRLVFRDEPDIVVVPGSRVYYIRDYDYDIYRYGSFWYYNYDGGWYRARRYKGPYVYIGYQSVPRAVAYVPVKYRRHWRGSPGHDHAHGHYKDGHHDKDARHDKEASHDKGHGHGHGRGD